MSKKEILYPKIWDENTLLLYEMYYDSDVILPRKYKSKVAKIAREVDEEDKKISIEEAEMKRKISLFFKKYPVGERISYPVDGDWRKSFHVERDEKGHVLGHRWTGIVVSHRIKDCQLLVEDDKNKIDKKGNIIGKERGRNRRLVDFDPAENTIRKLKAL